MCNRRLVYYGLQAESSRWLFESALAEGGAYCDGALQAAQLLRHAIVVDMPCDTATSQNKPNEGENLYLLQLVGNSLNRVSRPTAAVKQSVLASTVNKSCPDIEVRDARNVLEKWAVLRKRNASIKKCAKNAKKLLDRNA